MRWVSIYIHSCSTQSNTPFFLHAAARKSFPGIPRAHTQYCVCGPPFSLLHLLLFARFSFVAETAEGEIEGDGQEDEDEEAGRGDVEKDYQGCDVGGDVDVCRGGC